MRSALLCVLFTIITKPSGSLAQDDDFRPTPIPINYWPFEERDGRSGSGTSQEIIDAPAKTPAHYWEDALRHSVYLTLVRDKIDQLIAKGDVISPQSKPEGINKELDDLDLWDKIKGAPFERLASNELDSFGDVTVMSKGRLIDDGKHYRFTEDERSKEKCGNATCMDGVKAYWSVKRVRQRDGDSSHHYELTFSVITQAPKQQKRPYENPTRTFTVRESSPETIVDRPLEKRHYETQTQAPRAERALWFHKNIIPTQRHQGRQYQIGLDRIFGSLFSDDDDYEVIRYKTVPAQTPATNMQYSKIGYVGASSEQNQQHKKLVPYPYKPHTIKYAPRPPPQIQPHPHHYLDMDSIGVVSAPYEPQYDHKYVQPGTQHKYIQPVNQDNRYVQPVGQDTRYVHPVNQEHKYVQPANQEHKFVQPGSFEHKYIQPANQEHKYLPPVNQEHKYILGKPYKQVRPPILPTPLPPLPQPSESPVDNTLSENTTTEETKTNEEAAVVVSQQTNTTRAPESTTTHTKARPNPVKVSYFPEHVRPPVYNAPPGIFVTMDKKPFKPMPPLRYHSTKPIKVHKPIDFRPSPQVLDAQFSEPVVDGAFRPITVKYENETTTTEKVEVVESIKPPEKVIRKATSTTNKPIHKKHENKKAYAFTTAPTLDIITAQIASEDSDSDLHWANLLGAFSRTTPMGAPKVKSEAETTTPLSTTTTLKSTSKRTTTTTEKVMEEATTTTEAPKKRTRPPPKFTKPEKVKKHKRGSSTTTKAPEKQKNKRLPSDLIPQASSAAAGKLTTKWSPSSTTQTSSSSSTTTTTTTAPTTTTRQTTTEPQKPTSTTVETYTATEKPKSKNRYRQSTLMTKGTSVKHDKWSGFAADSNFKRPVPASGPPRRKGSNFQGYVTPSTARPTDDEYYEDIPSSSLTPKIGTTEALVTRVEHQDLSSGTKTTQSNYEDTVDQYEAVSEAQTAAELSEEDEEENQSEEEVTDEQETKDHTEFMFYPKSTAPNDRTNEIDEPLTTEQTVVTSTHSVAKNKTRCKHKKKKPTTTEAYEFEEEEDMDSSEPVPKATTTTVVPSTPDIFDDLFGGFTFDADEKPQEDKKTTSAPAADQEEEESENHEKYAKLVDEDFEDFLDELDKEEGNAKNDESFYNEDEKDDSAEAFDEDGDEEVDENDDKREKARGAQDYEDIQHSPYSLFELMAME